MLKLLKLRRYFVDVLNRLIRNPPILSVYVNVTWNMFRFIHVKSLTLINKNVLTNH